MKRSMLIILCVGFLFSTIWAGGKDQKYGKPLTLKKKTNISAILANPDSFNGKRVLVEGLVIDVCEKRGCWMNIASDKEFEFIQFKVEDGVIVFPMEAKGKKATAEGIISVINQTEEQLIEQARHHAEEQGELDSFDPSTITGPKIVIRLMGEGAVIK